MTCQYNETLCRTLIYDDPEAGHKLPSTCEKEAVLVLGKQSNRWYLCAECAGLPIFKRLRSREPIGHEVSREEQAA